MAAGSVLLGSLTAKAVGDRWRGVAIGAVSLGLMLLLGMAAYRELDLSIYTSLPEVFLEMVGIPPDADVAGLAYNAIYASYGTLTLAALAIAMGSSSIAGEERDGTLGLLLGNPRSRTRVLAARAGSLVLLLGLASAFLYAAAVLSPVALGVQVGGLHLGALVAHMFAGALFHGFVALAVGAWTGQPGRAVAAATALLVVSFFAVGLLPLFSSVADAVRLFPWYYVNGARPLVDGASSGHLAVLVVGSLLLGAVALVGVNRRDLRQSTAGARLLDHLRTDPRVARVVERLSGGTRVSRIWVKSVSDHQAVVVVTALAMFSMMGVMLGPMYAAIEETIATTAELPEVILAIAGGGDISTPEGWYRLETFGLMAPISVMVVTMVVAVRGLAGEEQRRTMGLLLANPIPRSRVVLEKAVAMVVVAAVVGVATFLGVAAGSALGGLGMDLGNIAAAASLQVLVGLLFGGVALAIAAATGRSRTAVGVTVGLALSTYLLNSFAILSEGLAGLARLSPFRWYLGNDPLRNGMDWGAALGFVVVFAALVAASVRLFDGRDLRNG